jgi:magnesium chelatase subunit I
LDLDTEIEIMDRFTSINVPEGIEFKQTGFIKDIVAGFTQLLRKSSSVNQHSGVSVSLTLSNLETAASNAIRRAIVNGDSETSIRISDLNCLIDSTLGKVELETFDDEDTSIIDKTLNNAILYVFNELVAPEMVGPIVALFDNGLVIECADDLPNSHYIEALDNYPELKKAVVYITGEMDPVFAFNTNSDAELKKNPSLVATTVEFILEGLHLKKRLNKSSTGSSSTYTTRQIDLKFNK